MDNDYEIKKKSDLKHSTYRNQEIKNSKSYTFNVGIFNNTLPNDIWYSIFKYCRDLDDKVDLKGCENIIMVTYFGMFPVRFVCKQFYNIVKCVKFDDYNAYEMVQDFAIRGHVNLLRWALDMEIISFSEIPTKTYYRSKSGSYKILYTEIFRNAAFKGNLK